MALNLAALRSRVESFVLRHRGLTAAFALPVSFVVDRLDGLRHWYAWSYRSAPELHDQRVRRVQEQVRTWAASGSKKPMCTARKPWQTMSTRVASYKQDCSRIEIDLRDILEVNPERRTVRLEPLVTMGQITQRLLPLGFALAVMIEMDDLTIGGVCMGLGMATSSHREGLIQETVVAYEVVLADGSLVRATREEHADLFHALPWSHGTLGLLVAVELKIVPIKPYVHLEYRPCHSQGDYCEQLGALACAEDAPDFLEATIYGKERAVIMVGRLADRPQDPRQVNAIGRWHKPWFYKHVETFLRAGPGAEYVPLRQYYHRHTRSIFWELESMLPFGNHPVFRWLLGWLGAPKVSLLKLTMSPKGRQELAYRHVVQDFIVPLDRMAEAIEQMDQRFACYPLLVYPIRIYDHGGRSLVRKPAHLLPGEPYQMFVDLGVYGIPPAVQRGEPWDGPGAIRALETYARAVGGYQCLYADTFMTREEFEQMLDHTGYREVRRKYGAIGAFPEVYDKVRFREPRPAESQG